VQGRHDQVLRLALPDAARAGQHPLTRRGGEDWHVPVEQVGHLGGDDRRIIWSARPVGSLAGQQLRRPLDRRLRIVERAGVPQHLHELAVGAGVAEYDPYRGAGEAGQQTRQVTGLVVGVHPPRQLGVTVHHPLPVPVQNRLRARQVGPGPGWDLGAAHSRSIGASVDDRRHLPRRLLVGQVSGRGHVRTPPSEQPAPARQQARSQH
jgi:hypothetical protein